MFCFRAHPFSKNSAVYIAIGIRIVVFIVVVIIQ